MLSSLIEALRYELGEAVDAYLTLTAHYLKRAGQYYAPERYVAREIAKRLVDVGPGRTTGKAYVLDPTNFLTPTMQTTLAQLIPGAVEDYARELSAELSDGETSVAADTYGAAGADALKAKVTVVSVTSPKTGKAGFRITLTPTFEALHARAFARVKAHYLRDPALAAAAIDRGMLGAG